MSMRWRKPGRFGHVPVAGVCECPNTTIDSTNIVLEPVSISLGGLWAMFFCEDCGGTGALNVSCEQPLLETFNFSAVDEVMELWMNQTHDRDYD